MHVVAIVTEEDEDIDSPSYDALETFAKLLRAANPRKRLRGNKGDALRELAEIEKVIRRRDAAPGERARIHIRLWHLNDETALGIGQFGWRSRRRPRGAKSKSTDSNVDYEILMQANDIASFEGSFGAALRVIVVKYLAEGRLSVIAIESHIQRLRRQARRRGLQRN